MAGSKPTHHLWKNHMSVAKLLFYYSIRNIINIAKEFLDESKYKLFLRHFKSVPADVKIGSMADSSDGRAGDYGSKGQQFKPL